MGMLSGLERALSSRREVFRAALDSVISDVSPGWASRRAHARSELARSQAMARGFNAITKSRRASDWVAVGDGNPTEPGTALHELRKRAREMSRNSPYFVAANNAIVGQVVGKGIRASISHPNASVQKRLQRRWDAWARSKACDASGRMNLYGLQDLAMRTIVESGEVLGRRVVDRRKGFRIQLLPSEFLSSQNDTHDPTQASGVIEGVEVDSFGAPAAYHLHRSHPRLSAGDVIRVPASEIAHAFRMERAGQVRGIPWIAPVFTRLMDWDDYEDAELLRQKVSACFGVIYKGEEPPDGYSMPEKIEPGMSEYVPPGTEVEFVSPPASQGLNDMAGVNHRAVATGLGITYEALTGDFRKVNFSSGRMAHMQMSRNVVDWQQHIMIECLLDRIFEWWAEYEELRTGVNATAATAEWTVKGRDLIDPQKEITADVHAIRAGLKTWSESVRERGKDPQKVAAEWASDLKRFDELEIISDTDPRKVSAFGQGAVNIKDEGDGDADADADDQAA